MKITSRAVFVFTMLLWASPIFAETPSEIFTIGPALVKAFQDLNSAQEDLDKVQAIVKEIENKKTPSVTNNNWANLAQRYKGAAKSVSTAPLATDFDGSKYSFSLDQLRNCNTRDASLAKARGYLDELRTASEGKI